MQELNLREVGEVSGGVGWRDLAIEFTKELFMDMYENPVDYMNKADQTPGSYPTGPKY